MREHREIDLEDHFRWAISKDLSEQVTYAPDRQDGASHGKSRGNYKYQDPKVGKSLENPKNRKGNELRTSCELEGRVLR